MGINSRYHHITNHTQLMYTIMQINASRVQQEDDLKHKIKEIYYSFQPAELLKSAFSRKDHGSKIPKNMMQSALSLGTNLLISKLFRRGGSIKRYLLSLAMEKITGYAMSGRSKFITNGVNKLDGLIKNLNS
jgi:hypothetical protein